MPGFGQTLRQMTVGRSVGSLHYTSNLAFTPSPMIRHGYRDLVVLPSSLSFTAFFSIFSSFPFPFISVLPSLEYFFFPSFLSAILHFYLSYTLGHLFPFCLHLISKKEIMSLAFWGVGVLGTELKSLCTLDKLSTPKLHLHLCMK